MTRPAIQSWIMALVTAAAAMAIRAAAGGGAIGTPNPDDASPAAASAAAVTHQGTLDFSGLIASDILLTDALIEYRQTRRASDWAFLFYHGHIGMRYAPEPPFGSRIYAVLKEEEVEDEHWGVNLRTRLDLAPRWKLVGAAGAYDGFAEYRSLWLNQFYRQLEAGLSPRYGTVGYQEPDPWGAHASAGIRWDYLPGLAYAQFEGRYAHDRVAPGYNINLHYYPLRLEPNTDQLDTWSGRLTLENVLGSRWRALQEVQVADTTARQPRFTLQSSLNWAVSERWVARLLLGGATEAPGFDAWWTALSVERDWRETWFVSLVGRYYQDTGQYEQALPGVNNAAPPLQTWQVALGLRWQGSRTAARLLIGPYFTHYEPTRSQGPGSFANLYRDRDWLAVQFTLSRQF